MLYFFAFLAIISSIQVILTKDPVKAVISLICTFLFSASIFIAIEAEFIAMVLIIVYAGAVSIFFLFVVMMFDLSKIKQRVRQNILPICFAASIFIFDIYSISSKHSFNYVENWDDQLSNAERIGNILYTDYIYAFQLVGLILIIAMIGAIPLTLSKRTKKIKKQVYFSQVISRSSKLKE